MMDGIGKISLNGSDLIISFVILPSWNEFGPFLILGI